MRQGKMRQEFMGNEMEIAGIDPFGNCGEIVGRHSFDGGDSCRESARFGKIVRHNSLEAIAFRRE